MDEYERDDYQESLEADAYEGTWDGSGPEDDEDGDDTGPEPREDFGWFGDENLCGE